MSKFEAKQSEWFKRFKDDRESVEDRKHFGQPSTCTTPEMIAKVREVNLEDRLRLKGRRFVFTEEIQAESQPVLNTLMPADFSECFQKWQNRWGRCIQAQGDYFEGDGGN